METLNINQLLLREDQKRVESALQAIGAVQFDSTVIEREIKAALGQHFRALLVSNKESRHPTRDGHFMLELSLKGIQLLEQKSMQKLQYRYSLSDNKLTLNDRSIDSSFTHPFITKINHVANLLQAGQAHCYAKESI